MEAGVAWMPHSSPSRGALTPEPSPHHLGGECHENPREQRDSLRVDGIGSPDRRDGTLFVRLQG